MCFGLILRSFWPKEQYSERQPNVFLYLAQRKITIIFSFWVQLSDTHQRFCELKYKIQSFMCQTLGAYFTNPTYSPTCLLLASQYTSKELPWTTPFVRVLEGTVHGNLVFLHLDSIRWQAWAVLKQLNLVKIVLQKRYRACFSVCSAAVHTFWRQNIDCENMY